MQTRQTLKCSFYWDIAGQIPESSCETLLKSALAVDSWLGTACLVNNPAGRLSKIIGGIHWKPSPYIWKKLGFHHVEFSTVFFDPVSLPFETATHEIGHVLDNSLGSHPLSSIFGGGPSDDLARFIGFEPDVFFPRFHASGYEQHLKQLGLELNPTAYGRLNGPAEDFAESFRLAVLEPKILINSAPLRYQWFERWKLVLIKRFEK
jgi:hypothetical protein